MKMAGCIGFLRCRFGFDACGALWGILNEDIDGTPSSPSSYSVAVVMSASLPMRRARAKAAVLGAFVADAASCPLQGIYDLSVLTSLLSPSSPAEEGWEFDRTKMRDPAFYPVPSCPWFDYPVGASSPYGDEILPLLRHLAAEAGGGGGSAGDFDPEGFAAASYEFLRAYPGRLNQVSKLFVEARDAGKTGADAAVDDAQAHGLVKVPLVVARHCCSDDDDPSDYSRTLRAVESAVRVHQRNDASVDASLAFAAILRRLILAGGSVRDAAHWAETSGDSPVSPDQRAILTEVRMAGKGIVRLSRVQIGIWGLSGSLPGVWKGLLYVAVHAESYREAVSFKIWAGGDVCSRNIGIGALWGAATAVAGGMEGGEEEEERGIPMEWRKKTNVLEEVEGLVNKMLG